MKFVLISDSAKYCSYKELYRLAVTKIRKMDSDDKWVIKVLRTTLIVLFTLQLVSTLERQVFDFLGYMWAPIMGNFFQIIIVIFGIYGACNYHRPFIIVYATWSLIWLGWNIFVVCLYLEVGVLDRNRERYILTIGTEGKSWWLEHGIGCEVTNTSWQEEVVVDTGRNSPPEAYVAGCILQYYYVEVIHAAVQCLLSLTGLVVSCISVYSFMEDDDPNVSSANDELEFVKMRYRTPTHMSAYHDDSEDMAFDNINLTSEVPSLSRSQSRPRSYGDRENPPSYDTTMQNVHSTATASYGAGRHSVRSKASTRSKRSTHRQTSGGGSSAGYSEPVRDLPWVHISPSTSNDNQLIRHYP